MAVCIWLLEVGQGDECFLAPIAQPMSVVEEPVQDILWLCWFIQRGWQGVHRAAPLPDGDQPRDPPAENPAQEAL